MAATDLRPLSLGELLDRTFSYYRKHFLLFVGIMALPQALIVATNRILLPFRTPRFTAAPPSPEPAATAAPPAMPARPQPRSAARPPPRASPASPDGAPASAADPRA